MLDAYLSQALRRLDHWLLAVCDGEQRRAQVLAGGEAVGWDAVRNLVRPALGELIEDPGGEPPELLPSADHPLHRLGDGLGLTACEREAILVLLAAHLDPRYQALFAVLHDDLGQRRPTERLLLTVLGRTPMRRRTLTAALQPGGRLVRAGLVIPEEGWYAPLAQPFRLPADLLAVLCGTWPPALPNEPAAIWHPPAQTRAPAPEAHARLLGIHGAGERAEHARRLAPAELGALWVALPADPGHAREAARAAWRLGLALGVLPLLEVGELDEPACAALVHECERLVHELGGRLWLLGPRPLAIAAPQVQCPVNDWRARRDAWLAEAAAHGVALDAEAAGRLAAAHRHGRTAIARVFAATASLDEAGLGAAARRLAAARVEHSCERPARRGFEDLVLRETTREALERLVFFVGNRDRIAEARGLAHRYGLDHGPVVLFSGRSGTGKTLAAEAVAKALGRPLHVVDLATLLSKYIGETEKHVDRALTQAETAGAVLFFDEADALFTTRREQAGSAGEQFANVLVSYLLQRIERHDGLAILATNLRRAIDEAFLRRFEARIEFPLPNAGERLQLWELMLPPGVPRAGDLDLAGLAAAHRLSGGEIRNAALKAILIAERAAVPLAQSHLERAVALELLELGRLSRDPAGHDAATDRGALLRAAVEEIEAGIESHLQPRFLKEIHVVAGAPTDDNLAGRRPAVSVALFRIAGKRGVDGLRAGFIVSAWSHRPEEENELLGTVHEALTALSIACVAGRPATLRVQESHDFELLHRFWSSHGHPMRASVVVDVEIGASGGTTTPGA